MFIKYKVVALILVLTLDCQAIYGGHEVAPHSRPYMVLLVRHMQNGKTSYCAGFLLNEDFVMTAAHCQAKSYNVLLGVHNINHVPTSTTIQNITVANTFPHKGYNPTDYSNDIMLLQLSSKAHFNNNVKPIVLVDQGGGSLPKSCIVSGWGRNDKNQNYMSPVLMEVSVTLTDNEQCPKENSYCSEGEAGPRQGDTGSPLVCEDGRAFGVVSSGSPNIYRYAKITDYSGDIEGSIEKEPNICMICKMK